MTEIKVKDLIQEVDGLTYQIVRFIFPKRYINSKLSQSEVDTLMAFLQSNVPDVKPIEKEDEDTTNDITNDPAIPDIFSKKTSEMTIAEKLLGVKAYSKEN